MTLVPSCNRSVVWAFALVVLLAIPIALPLLVTEATPSSRLLDKGDWVVSGVESVNAQTIRMTGNLTIGHGGSLTLTNSTLGLNLSTDGGFQISILTGGTLELTNSVVRSTVPGLRYKVSVSNSTFGANHSTIENFTTLSFFRSTANFKNTNILDNGATVLLATISGVTMNGCVLTMRGSGDAINLSNGTLDLRYSTLQNNGDSKNTGIEISGHSTVTSYGTDITKFSNGTIFRDGSMMLDGPKITDSADNGILQFGGSSVITNGIFQDNQQGVEILGGSTNLSMIDIWSRGTSIKIENSLAYVDHNTIHSSAEGMYVANSSAYITDNLVKDNGIGIKLFNSKYGSIDGNVFQNNTLGLSFEASTMTFKDCDLANLVTDVQVSGSTVTSLNSTYKNTNISADSHLSVDWYLDIEVEGSTHQPISGALIDLASSLGKHLTRTTGYDGWARKIEVTQYTKGRYGTTTDLPYSIKASYLAAQGSVTINVTRSMIITITLVNTDIYIKSVSPSNISMGVNRALLINMTVASSIYPFKGVGLRVLEDGNLYSTDQSFDLPAETNVTVVYTPTNPGTHTVTILIDPKNAINDMDRTNNARTITVTVTGGGGGGGGNFPDLSVIGITPDTSSFQVGQTIPVTVEVQNSGNAGANAVTVWFLVDGKKKGDNQILSIPAGSMKSTVFQWAATTGHHNLTVEVDPANTIGETNENNNQLSTPVDISTSNPNNAVNDAVALMCITVLVVIVVIIIVIIYAMAKRSKPQSYQHYQYPYGQQYQYQPQYSYPTSGTYAGYPATNYSSGPQPMTPPVATPGPTAQEPSAGKNMCPRCRSTNIRTFDDGHKLCEKCRKIFF